MQGLQGGQEASSGPVPQAWSRTDLRTRELRLPDCPSPLYPAFSLSLSLSLAGLGRLSGAEEINKQVERLKSPALEADVTLLRAEQTDTSLRAEQLDGWMSGCMAVAPGQVIERFVICDNKQFNSTYVTIHGV